MIKTFLIASILISFVICGGASLDGAFLNRVSNNYCFWNKCQDETKAFSIYYDALTDPVTKGNAASLCQDCGILSNSKAIDICEKVYSYASLESVEAFNNFYKCIRSSCFSLSLDTCRAYSEGCEYALSHTDATSFVTDVTLKGSFTSSISSCTYSTEASCPTSLGTTAKASCIQAGKKKCAAEWLEQNKISSSDPCYPCDIYSSSSIIIFSYLLSFLFIVL